MEHTWSLACWEGSNITRRWWLLDKQLTSESAVGKHKKKMCGILWSPSETEHLKHIEPIAESSAVTAHSSAKLFSLSLVPMKSKPSIKVLFILIGQPHLQFIKSFDLPKHSFPQDPTACSDPKSAVNTTYSYKQNLARPFRQWASHRILKRTGT